MSKIMLVEDNESIRSLLALILEMEGYQVVQSNGEGSIEELYIAIMAEAPSLLLLDVNLRKLSGLDLLKQLRLEYPKQEELKVLMSSGSYCGPECKSLGADGFIMKPYMPDELVSQIKSMIG